MRDGNTLALVMAGGDGARLRTLTTVAGTSIPKQYCSLRGGASLLEESLARAGAVTSRHNISAVVAEQHRHWWLTQLGGMPAHNIVIQPRNRGTANGILLSLLSLFDQNRGARIVLLPADHHVREESTLACAMRAALDQLQPCSEEILLLGVEPEEADPELGYMVPGSPDGRARLRVVRFVEKPTILEARELIGAGALWNSFIVASTVHGLLSLFARGNPDIVHAMRRALRWDRLAPGSASAVGALYDELATVDFSRDVLAKQISHLRVLRVPSCGWTDLGTPERVARVLHRTPRRADEESRAPASNLSLAAQTERLRGDTLALRP